DEIPVGAVIVRDGEIIAWGFNRNRELNDPTMHAEIIAIRDACRAMNNERLTGCDLYVTKEPCAMCAGAIVHSRIRKVIIGAGDIKYGACGTVLDVCGNAALNHRPEIIFGIKKEESASLLKKFFKQKREALKEKC
ncbi:MAG TPA: tRNA adenosine(34) deaminase TadA, partial [Spirochaetota bacterium]|nr:tRNA adenosine(34) deaminase TadA [Spirochaetota bacterium]